jgi:hypothetical protein
MNMNMKHIMDIDMDMVTETESDMDIDTDMRHGTNILSLPSSMKIAIIVIMAFNPGYR